MTDYGMTTDEGNRRIGEILDDLIPAQGRRYGRGEYRGTVERTEVEADGSDLLLVVVLDDGRRFYYDLLALATERLEVLALSSVFAEAAESSVVLRVVSEARRRWSK